MMDWQGNEIPGLFDLMDLQKLPGPGAERYVKEPGEGQVPPRPRSRAL